MFLSVMPLCDAAAFGQGDAIEKELYCLSSSRLTCLIAVGTTSKIYAESFKAKYEQCNWCSLFCFSVNSELIHFS